ncbi:MAG: hypothetical protein K9G58_13665 [Bacteroidales bacterium]|nr:hypothetical protein [Bacteroidales bacterium]MCF8399217.1 hypothetical protein [Bacteroidales bacterium]
MSELTPDAPLSEALLKKAGLKQNVYQHTLNTFLLFKDAIQSIVKEHRAKYPEKENHIPFEYKIKGDFEIELKFAGDILIFLMHTNIFEIPRDHLVMKSSYLKEDRERSYCGIINIYNFLADSFKYKRVNDVGYLIGRVFINKDMHYFIEGKREIGLLYNNFHTAVMDEKAAREIVASAIRYTINFDLLTPPFDTVKEITVHDIQSALDNISLKTAKRMGFKFQADEE